MAPSLFLREARRTPPPCNPLETVMKKLPLVLCLMAGLALAPAASNAADTPWKPRKPITIMTPVPAGGSADMMLRAASSRLKEVLGVPVVIAPTPGGQNTANITKLLASARDGHTLITHGSPRIMLANIFREDPFQYEDLRPVVSTNKGNTLFVQAPDSGGFMDFVEKAKANPGKLNVGVMGVKTGYHAILMAELMQTLGIDFNIVPFAGAGQVVSGIVGGHIDAGVIEGINTAVKPTLLLNGKTDIPELADVPAPADLGLPQSSLYNITGFFVPSDTPDEIVQSLEALLTEALSDCPEFDKIVQSYTMSPLILPGAEYKKILDENRQLVMDLKDAGKIEMN